MNESFCTNGGNCHWIAAGGGEMCSVCGHIDDLSERVTIKKSIIISNGHQTNKRFRVGLLPEELMLLREYIKGTRGAIARIREETKVHPDTLREGLSSGVYQVEIACKLRDFLKTINK